MHNKYTSTICDIIIDRDFDLPLCFYKEYIDNEVIYYLFSKILTKKSISKNFNKFLTNISKKITMCSIKLVIDLLIINNKFEYIWIFKPKDVVKGYKRYWKHKKKSNDSILISKTVLFHIIESYLNQNIPIPKDILYYYFSFIDTLRLGYFNILKIGDLVGCLLYTFLDKIDLIYPILYTLKIFNITLSKRYSLTWYYSHGGTIYINPKNDPDIILTYLKFTKNKFEYIDSIRQQYLASNDEEFKYKYRKTIMDNIRTNINKIYYIAWDLDFSEITKINNYILESEIPLEKFNSYKNITKFYNADVKNKYILNGGNYLDIYPSTPMDTYVDNYTLLYYIKITSIENVRKLLQNDVCRQYLYTQIDSKKLEYPELPKITVALFSDPKLYKNLPSKIYNILLTNINLIEFGIKYPYVIPVMSKEFDTFSIKSVLEKSKEVIKYIPTSNLPIILIYNTLLFNYIKLNYVNDIGIENIVESERLTELISNHKGYLLDIKNHKIFDLIMDSLINDLL